MKKLNNIKMKNNKTVEAKPHKKAQRENEIPKLNRVEGSSKKRNGLESLFLLMFLAIFKHSEFDVFVSENLVANRLSLRICNIDVILPKNLRISKKQLNAISKIVDNALPQQHVNGRIITCFNDEGITEMNIESYVDKDSVEGILVHNIYNFYNFKQDFFHFDIGRIRYQDLTSYLYSIDFKEDFEVRENISNQEFRRIYEEEANE